VRDPERTDAGRGTLALFRGRPFLVGDGELPSVRPRDDRDGRFVDVPVLAEHGASPGRFGDGFRP
jgi:hypothetical protein